MDEIAQIIENALSVLNLNTDRLMHMKIEGREETDPYIVYNQVTQSPNLFTDDREVSRTFFIDVDIYTTNPGLIDSTSKSVQTLLKEAGFSFKPSAGTIVEDDSEPIWYHEPLEFEYEKEM